MGNDYKIPDEEPSDLPRTQQLETLINGKIKGGTLTFRSATRVDDGILISYGITPDDHNIGEMAAGDIVSPDFALSEMAKIIRQKAEDQIAFQAEQLDDFPDDRTEIGQ